MSTSRNEYEANVQMGTKAKTPSYEQYNCEMIDYKAVQAKRDALAKRLGRK